MPDSSKIREFPDISNKLTAPSKKSVFERQKEEAEAKRQREEAETAAVYQDFVKSFEDDAGPGRSANQRFADNFPGSAPSLPPIKAGGGARRHFAPSRGLKSGPGSLASAPPSRKRPLDEPYQRQKDRGIFAFDDAPSTAVDARAAFQASDEDDRDQSPEERAAPKPTLQLSSLPPGTSVPVIKALLPTNLSVDSVRLMPHKPASASTDRKSLSAIVTLAKDTPASDIDTAVNSLQNQYLGLGFNLSISRHLSSALLGSTGASTLPSLVSSSLHPFGAKPIFSGSVHPLNRAPPPRGGFAPPPSYAGQGQAQFGRGSGSNVPLQVPVKPPADIRELKLIHKTVEAVLTHGPEFEALLMSRPRVQRDEKWAWLWDARSVGGVWYRWRLWELLSGQEKVSGRPETVFDGAAQWRAPERNLRFEFSTQFEDFVGNEDYDSSEEEESGDEGQRLPGGDEEDDSQYLNPLQKAKLTHLLSRLPSTTARLRKGDVARVTAFAISHSGRGSDEVVQMLIDNVERPFVLSSANPTRLNNVNNDGANEASDLSENEDREKEKEDPSSAKLIALYLISDLLSSSSTSGVRHAWRYRQLFESALRFRRTFKRLGQLEREMKWGRLRAEKWRRAVTQVLELWEGWCVFSSDAQEQLMVDFIDSAEDKSEKETLETEKKAQQHQQEKKKTVWKAVDKDEAVAAMPNVSGNELDGAAMEEDLDDQLLAGEDEDVDGEPMDEDLDGVPMSDGSDEDVMNQDAQTDDAVGLATNSKAIAEEVGNQIAEGRRQRPRAVDMFAESDEE
jgi:U2-associated protein SR140